MSTTTASDQRADLKTLRRHQMIEIAEGSQYWLRVEAVHSLPAQSRFLVDGTLYVDQRQGRKCSVEFLSTETPRTCPPPPRRDSWWRQLTNRWRNAHA